jgi:hypothetical protein
MKVDLNSATWEVVRTSIEAAITKAQTKLEQPLSIDETNIERGKIIALREVLKLGAPARPPMMTGEVSGY